MGALEGMRSLGTLTGPMIGGWLYESLGFRAPFLLPAAFMLLMLGPLSVVAITQQHGGLHEHAPAVDQLAFMRRPPVVALLFLVVVAIIPLSLVEPSMEPHLSAAPYFLTPRQVWTACWLRAVGNDVKV